MFLPAIINLFEPFATLTSWRTKARIKNILFLTTIPSNVTITAKKKVFSIKDFFSKYDQICDFGHNYRGNL